MKWWLGAGGRTALFSLCLSALTLFAQPSQEPSAGPGGANEPPVIVRTQVEVDRGGYRYHYIIENRGSQAVRMSAFGFIQPAGARIEPSPAGDALLTTAGMDHFWGGILPRGSRILPLWNRPLPGGGSVEAAVLWSLDPPGAGGGFLDPWAEEDFDSRLEASLGRRCIPSPGEVAKWRTGARRGVRLLSPAPAERGTYAHWDRMLSDFGAMERAHWLSSELADLIKECLNRARRAAASHDSEGVRMALAKAREALSPEGGSAARDEVNTYFGIHQELLLEETFPSSAPAVRISLEPSRPSLGQAASIEATATDDSGPKALAGRRLRLEVVTGSDAGEVQVARTDERGRALFRLEGRALGEDGVRVGLLTEGPGQKVEAWGATTVEWRGAPNLQVFSFVPPMLISGPGHFFYVNECTQNAGTAPAGASVTRYFVVPSPGAAPSERIPLGQRRVPPLGPGQMSCVVNGALVLPRTVPEGRLYLEAEADILNQVPESEEGDNGSSGASSGGSRNLSLAMGAQPPSSGPSSPKPLSPVPSSPRAPSAGAEEAAIPWVDPRFIQPTRQMAFGAGPDEAAAPPPETCYSQENWVALVKGRTAGGLETYYFSRTDLPPGLLKAAIGKVTVSWYRLEMPSHKTHVDWKDFRTWEPVSLPTYVKGPSGFVPSITLSLTDLRPFGSDRDNEGSSLTFFGTAREGDFVEAVLDTASTRRAWLRLSEPTVGKVGVSYACLSGEYGGESPGHPDWAVFNAHPVLKLRLAPDSRAPWLPFTDDKPYFGDADPYDYGLYMGEQVNGFVRVYVSGEGPDLTVGWLPVRDADGALLLWPVWYGC